LKEVGMAYLKAQSWHSPGETEENHQILSLDNQYSYQDMNHIPPKYTSGALLLHSPVQCYDA